MRFASWWTIHQLNFRPPIRSMVWEFIQSTIKGTSKNRTKPVREGASKIRQRLVFNLTRRMPSHCEKPVVERAYRTDSRVQVGKRRLFVVPLSRTRVCKPLSRGTSTTGSITSFHVSLCHVEMVCICVFRYGMAHHLGGNALVHVHVNGPHRPGMAQHIGGRPTSYLLNAM